MKKLLVLLVVLSVATIANAGLKISVDGVVDGPDPILMPSQTVMIDISSDGQTLSDVPCYLLIDGPGILDVTNAVNLWLGPSANPFVTAEDWYPEDMAGKIFVDMASPAVPTPFIMAGTVCDGVVFHCEDIGMVTLSFVGDYRDFGGELVVFDTQVIQQIPEPMTMGLLGLGALFLRRRK